MMGPAPVSHALLVGAVLLTGATAGAQIELTARTIDGGGVSSGGTFTMTMSIGQPDAGASSGGTFELFGGFLPGGATAPPCAGDTDGSGAVDIDDIVNVILCFGGTGVNCPSPGINTDVNTAGGSAGVVDIDDIVTVVINFGACPGT